MPGAIGDSVTHALTVVLFTSFLLSSVTHRLLFIHEAYMCTCVRFPVDPLGTKVFHRAVRCTFICADDAGTKIFNDLLSFPVNIDRGCTSRSGLSMSSTAVVRYVRRKKAGGSFGSSRKEGRKKEDGRIKILRKAWHVRVSDHLVNLATLIRTTPHPRLRLSSFPTHSIPRHAISAMAT